MQSHCRGQGFDSPQLHQPPGAAFPTRSIARRTVGAACRILPYIKEKARNGVSPPIVFPVIAMAFLPSLGIHEED
jgi:hypothetical protein